MAARETEDRFPWTLDDNVIKSNTAGHGSQLLVESTKSLQNARLRSLKAKPIQSCHSNPKANVDQLLTVWATRITNMRMASLSVSVSSA